MIASSLFSLVMIKEPRTSMGVDLAINLPTKGEIWALETGGVYSLCVSGFDFPDLASIEVLTTRNWK